MGKKLFSLFTLFAVGLGVLFVNQATVNAQECQIITIHDREDSIVLHPETISISKGTCVIWINWSTASEISIMFEQGKVCKDVVQASMNFKLDKENCFISNLILSKGGTASLVYEKPGSFDYEAKTQKGKTVKGKIVVQ